MLLSEDLRMPQLYNFGGYIIYFWVNEGNLLNPYMYMFARDDHLQMGQKYG